MHVSGMFASIRSDVARTQDALLRQARHLNHDFGPRAVTLSLCTVLAATIVSLQWLVASLGVFLLTELSQYALYTRISRGRAMWERQAYVINAFFAGIIFTGFPMVIWYSGTGAGYVMGLGVMVTAIMHCMLIRTHHVGVCLATLAPLVTGLGVMVIALITDLDLAPSTAVAPIQTQQNLLVSGLFCFLCLGYLTCTGIDQNHIHRGMAQALAEAEAASRTKDRFLASMSHEIRTPLNGILGIAQVNRDAARNAQDTELAETLLSSGLILKSMVDDILDHAKIEAGKMTFDPAPMDMRQLCAVLVRLFHAEAKEKGIDLVIDIPEDFPATIVADRLRLHQILANLVSNAVKFTPSGEVRIAVSFDPAEDGSANVKVVVSDTGKGLSDAEIDVLFDAFTQIGDQTELAVKGTGLGLPISRGLATLMGGTLSVTSRQGDGAQFTLTFPAKSMAAMALRPERQNTVSSMALDGMSILVAEDNRTNRFIVRSFLKDTGALLTEAENGAIAVELAQQTRFDVILLDMRMPVMDGETAFRRLRDEGISAPIIALTANAMPEHRARYIEMGMNDYLSKPLSKKALLDVLIRSLPAEVAA
ncbi:Autoinducer 2 sensor kinase/phosphatase LuxQ [Palleronia abyssalis]|uniref:histidine kinase n=2 Tax=Palleronia abyssalis TaxID=1501240 RepID=A0A2R8BVH5_9RHOB|nr:Autoinducer 2 sensor kinase/phosphatase LuxQ [Palleronia abyssalis]